MDVSIPHAVATNPNPPRRNNYGPSANEFSIVSAGFWPRLPTRGFLSSSKLDQIAIAEAIRWLLTYSEQAEAMGQHGRDAVLSSYRWVCEADKLLGIYQTWSAEIRRAA